MSTTITQKLTVAGAVLAGALLLSAPGLATPMPLPAPTIPGVAPLPGPIAAASTPAANMGILKTKPDIGAAGTSFSLSGSGLGAEQGRQHRLEHRQRHVDGRRAARQRRLPRTESRQGQRRSRADEDRRTGRVLPEPEGAEGLRRHPRHVRGRRRRPGCEGRLPHRPHGDDDAEEGADRHDDHPQVLGPRLVAVRGRRIDAVRQPLRRRRHGELDPRRRDRQVPRVGPRRPPHRGDRRRDQLRLPQHPAVARSRGRSAIGSRSRSRRTPGCRSNASTGPSPSRRPSTQGRRCPPQGSGPTRARRR